jgi:cyclophilin family peptidyl-prolyl cis-trans isomerase
MIRRSVLAARQPVVRANRGARGRGWYFKALAEAAEEKPAPAEIPSSPAGFTRPQAFFDLSIDNGEAKRVTIELASDIVPDTVDNFIKLCTDKAESDYSYKNTTFHQIHKGLMITGGDVLGENGGGGHSASKQRYFADENYVIRHSQPGVVSMASNGIDCNGSQFFITTNDMSHLDGRNVAFGKVVDGMQFVTEVEALFNVKGRPLTEVVISDCGLV